MKRTLAMILALVMLLALCACGQAKPEPEPEAPAAVEEPKAEEPAVPTAEEVSDVTVPEFSVTVNGVTVDKAAMVDYPLYSVKTATVNSTGTASDDVYVGYAMADDAYASTFTGDIMANTTLLAVLRNGSEFKTAPWFAPCSSATTGDYLKNCVSILVNTTEGAPEIVVPAETKEEEAPAELELTGEAPDKQDKTDKVTFGDFSFLVNGNAVTNADLEGVSIYKISVVTENSKGTLTEATYTGYVLADVLEKLGVSGSVKAVADDGYENELSDELAASEYTLVAIEKDKEVGENGTIWIAPCSEAKSGSYTKNVVELIIG